MKKADSALVYCTDFSEVAWPKEAVFIVDRNVADAFSPATDHDGRVIYVDAGEQLKSLAAVEALAIEVLAMRSTRPLTLVAVGGGSTGDAVGFIASILWRGVSLWHVPTTLLAMVDSAHGGKTAVNLGGRKNQLGTFYPAEKVVVAEPFLERLPHDLREEGLVELIKVLWINTPEPLAAFDDAASFHHLLVSDVPSQSSLWQELLTAAVKAKETVVNQDPEEKNGLRRVLNLGHTAGHGLEATFALPHGRSVAWGLAACAILSHQHAGLAERDQARLLSHVAPLLTPLPAPTASDKRRFLDCLGVDKKQERGQLISILLEAPGRVVQTRDISPEMWWDAVEEAHQSWTATTLEARRIEGARTVAVELPADKSQTNRARIIEFLRPGKTTLHLPRTTLPDDVVDMTRALQALRAGSDEIYAGEGATVGRFVTALAATRPRDCHIRFGPGLLKRPHEALFATLRQAGAQITPTDCGVRVRGVESFPEEFHVDGRRSSQFASAIALLSASGASFRLQIEGPLASRPYFDLTLGLLEQCGVFIEELDENSFYFQPTPALQAPHDIEIPGDSSAQVVWSALAALEGRLFEPPDRAHPDAYVSVLLQQLLEARGTPVTADLSGAPDLAPVLSALATHFESALHIVNAGQLRFKESNRIDELAASFLEVGVTIEPTPEGIVVPAGVQRPRKAALFNARSDHRLAMAALVLAAHGTSLRVQGAQCVTKSYPDFWRHARRQGFLIEPVASS